MNEKKNILLEYFGRTNIKVKMKEIEMFDIWKSKVS